MTNTKQKKSEATKRRILDVALRLFMEEGYEKATMRKIARLAELTPGATYYYFKTKEHIIFHYYEQSFVDHLGAAKAVLTTESGLQARLTGLVKTHLEVAKPYHQISKALFKVASSPGNPLSPFSDESKYLRDQNIVLFQQAVNTTSDKVPEKLKDKLPEILWMYKILIIIYWLFDTTPEQEKTFRLVEKSAVLITKLISLSNLPGMGAFSGQIAQLFEEFKPYK